MAIDAVNAVHSSPVHRVLKLSRTRSRNPNPQRPFFGAAARQSHHQSSSTGKQPASAGDKQPHRSK